MWCTSAQPASARRPETRWRFHLSRCPGFGVHFSLQVGVGIWANSAWFLGLAAVSAGLLWWGVISREERYLEGKFGQAYLACKANVRRWI